MGRNSHYDLKNISWFQLSYYKACTISVLTGHLSSRLPEGLLWNVWSRRNVQPVRQGCFARD